jgi:hypothetical protein
MTYVRIISTYKYKIIIITIIINYIFILYESGTMDIDIYF